MSALARLYARVAFGPAAAVYDLLTDHAAWRDDCRALAALVPGPRVLDLGVGPGAGAIAMAGGDPARRHVGLDVSARMLRRARRRSRRARVPLALVRGDALALPARTGAFDGATAHSVLYLLPDPAAALREVGRALRVGPHHALAMEMWRGMSGLHRRFDEAALAGLLRAAGFERARAWPVLSGYGVMATAVRPG